MPDPRRRSPLTFRLWGLFAVTAFVAYVCSALSAPSYVAVITLTVLLILLLGSSVVVAITTSGATRVFWAAFASFGFAQCVALQTPFAGARTLKQQLHLWLFGDTAQSYSPAGIVVIVGIILISMLAAFLSRAVYVMHERRK